MSPVKREKMFPFDDQFGEPPTRNTLGVIDGAITWVAVAAVALVPTTLAVLFWPRLLAPMVGAVEIEGRRGVLLAPGTFFAFGIVAAATLAATLAPEGKGYFVAVGSDVGAAARQGQLWRIATLILPIFLGAVCVGLLAHMAIRILRVPDWSLTASLRVGLCLAVGLAIAMVGLEIATAPMLEARIGARLREAIILGGLGAYAFWALLGLLLGAERRLLPSAGAALLFGIGVPLATAVFYG
mgnify:CR=1 FL=1